MAPTCAESMRKINRLKAERVQWDADHPEGVKLRIEEIARLRARIVELRARVEELEDW